MKKVIVLFALVSLLGCKKKINCPDYADQGCGCYNTGSGTTPYAVTTWDPSASQCYYTDNLGNHIPVDKKYCTCR